MNWLTAIKEVRDSKNNKANMLPNLRAQLCDKIRTTLNTPIGGSETLRVVCPGSNFWVIIKVNSGKLQVYTEEHNGNQVEPGIEEQHMILTSLIEAANKP